MVITPDWESVGCEFEYKDSCFWKERPSVISLLLNSKWEKIVLEKVTQLKE